MRRTPLERKTPLHRTTPLSSRRSTPKRSRGISPATPEQRAIVAGRACLVCKKQPCHPAHLVDRSLAPECGDDPRLVVPLCAERCHRAYDDGDLDLSPYLEPHWRHAAAAAVEAIGLHRAVRRITKREWRPVEEGETA